MDDINEDSERSFELIDNGYKFVVSVNYPNNPKLVSQVVEIDKKLNIKSVSVMDNEGNVAMKMTFDKIDLSPTFDDDYFELGNLLKLTDDRSKDKNNNSSNEDNSNNIDNSRVEVDTNKDIENEKGDKDEDNTNLEDTKETATIDDIVYPMYLPDNTYLTSQERIETENGERLILTFEGDNPFILVEETLFPSDSGLIVSTNGDLEFLTDVIGVVSDNSVSWDSNGMEYFVASDVMDVSELIEIAKSISVLPVSK